MKAQLIIENIRFERGIDPKDAMKTGNAEARLIQRAKNFLQPVIDLLKELKKQDRKIRYIKFHYKDFRNELLLFEECYVEFQYGRNIDSSLYCSIGLDSDNDIRISLNDSKEQIKDKILSWIRNL